MEIAFYIFMGICVLVSVVWPMYVDISELTSLKSQKFNELTHVRQKGVSTRLRELQKQLVWCWALILIALVVGALCVDQLRQNDEYNFETGVPGGGGWFLGAFVCGALCAGSLLYIYTLRNKRRAVRHLRDSKE